MEATVLTVYGAEWCEDTQRSLRYLRRLGVEYNYIDIDADAAALDRAKALNHGRRRTPIIQIQGEVLVEPGNQALTEAVLRNGLVDRKQATDRLRKRNVGDLERGIRIGAGVALAALSLKTKPVLRVPLMALGIFETLSGAFGWCPAYSALGVTSIGGPLDHPMEAERESWLATADDTLAAATKVAVLK